MKTNLPLKHRRGFTLVEILAVVAIIGLLASIIVPSVISSQRKAKQAIAAQNLKGIAQAFVAYGNVIADGGTVDEGQANSVAKFAEVLARKAKFDRADVWYIEADQRQVSGSKIPTFVIEDGSNKMESARPAAWAVVVNAKRSKLSDPSYPLFWTRGLTADGKWNSETSPWGDEGGHIAFGDAHVKWSANLLKDEDKLIKGDGNDNKRTSSYEDAIGQDARRYEDS
jgi:prepilin-type N-terminal cleavage/methylation domain-containing protein